jgi:hypothetical protein
MVAVAKRPVAVEQVRERYETFVPDKPGIEKAEAFTVATLDVWGITGYTERAQGTVRALGSWLVRNDHPLMQLRARIRYEPSQGVLLTCLGDRGTMLPALNLYDALAHALRGLADRWGAEPVLSGRVLWAEIGPQLPWSVHYTWDVGYGISHPRHTHSRHSNAQQAQSSADAALTNHRTASGPKLLTAEVTGPEPSDC